MAINVVPFRSTYKGVTVYGRPAGIVQVSREYRRLTLVVSIEMRQSQSFHVAVHGFVVVVVVVQVRTLFCI